jgi:hypothetical protein
VHITTTEESIDIGTIGGFQGKMLGVVGSDEAIFRLEGIYDLKVLQLVTLGSLKLLEKLNLHEHMVQAANGNL